MTERAAPAAAAAPSIDAAGHLATALRRELSRVIVGQDAVVHQILIAFFAVLFGMVFFIADPEAGRFVALGLAAVMLLMAVVAKLSVDRARRRQTQEAKELLLSAEGLWLAGELHTWTVGGARLEGVTYAPEDRKILSFTYSTPGKNGPQYYTVRVLIPRGKEEEGAAVEAFFRDPERTRPQKGHRS